MMTGRGRDAGMRRIFVIEANSPAARRILETSVAAPLERDRVVGCFSDASYPELIDIERRGRGFFAWGLEHGEDNIANWMVMANGDYVLIEQGNEYRYCARIMGRYESRVAAATWWGQESGGALREYLFFLSEPIEISLPVDEFDEDAATRNGDAHRIPDGLLEKVEQQYRSIDRFVRKRILDRSVGGPILDASGLIQVAETQARRLKLYDPDSNHDARDHIFRAIAQRRGEPHFRQQLLTAYGGRCAITAFDAVDTLEAAYILPFNGKYTQHPSNGLLLRADLHLLFDIGKLAIDTRTMTCVLAPELMEGHYRLIVGRPLSFPEDPSLRPSKEGLDAHRRRAGL